MQRNYTLHVSSRVRQQILAHRENALPEVVGEVVERIFNNKRLLAKEIVFRNGEQEAQLRWIQQTEQPPVRQQRFYKRYINLALHRAEEARREELARSEYSGVYDQNELDEFIRPTERYNIVLNHILYYFYTGLAVVEIDRPKVLRISLTNAYFILTEKVVQYHDEMFINNKLTDSIFPIENIIDVLIDEHDKTFFTMVVSKTNIYDLRARLVNKQIDEMKKSGQVDYGALDFNYEPNIPDDSDHIYLYVIQDNSYCIACNDISIILTDCIRILQQRKVRRPDVLLYYYYQYEVLSSTSDYYY